MVGYYKPSGVRSITWSKIWLVSFIISEYLYGDKVTIQDSIYIHDKLKDVCSENLREE